MSDILERIRQQIFDEGHPPCPHCGEPIDMTGGGDSEMFMRHTTYHGDDGPQKDECPHCEKPIFIRECVRRSYFIGKTEMEAYD